jgi:hypothetical protein
MRSFIVFLFCVDVFVELLEGTHARQNHLPVLFALALFLRRQLIDLSVELIYFGLLASVFFGVILVLWSYFY